MVRSVSNDNANDNESKSTEDKAIRDKESLKESALINVCKQMKK